jgi:peptidoglycan/xylan/chitin deacetylase (PgdA/CDA1 family)
MILRSLPGKARALMLSALHRRIVPWGDRGPIVSFTFDDFPRSALTAGAGILEELGARATYYVAMGLMNTENRLGEQFHKDDLQTLMDRGHEVALHGFDHLSARRTPVGSFMRDLARCEEAVHACAPKGVSKNFAYPYGEASLSAKRRIGPRMASSRGTIPGLNGPEVDLNLLHANPLYGGDDSVAGARRLILDNMSRSSWLIFYSHDVRDEPSPYGCTPPLLRDIVAFARGQGAQVLTVAEVIGMLSAS